MVINEPDPTINLSQDMAPNDTDSMNPDLPDSTDPASEAKQKEKLIQKQILEKLKGLFHDETSGHDLSHLIRTYNVASHLQRKEGGDREVILVAALLHDIHRQIEKETGQFCPASESLTKVRELLAGIELSSEQIDRILHCIEFHEEYAFSKNGKTVEDIETLILQDADNLDAMGAIGIARTFSFGSAHNLPYWTPEIPVGKDHYDESDHDPSTIHHFYSKLLKLKNNMNTQTGKEMAAERDEFMRVFLDQFYKEWSGEL